MLHYIIQTVAFQLFFLLIYDVFLKKETFFNWNRMYLIVTSLLSIAIPFIKINRFKDVLPQEYIISLPEVVIGQSALNTNNTILLETVVINNSVSYWAIAFYIGVAIALSVFLYKLIRILVLIFKSPKIYQKDLTLVKLINSNAAFSFFRYVFLGDFIKSEERESILKHETVHVKHLHSLDLLFFEILRILFWFNPLVYMYQNRMNTLHEFIADAEAVKDQDKSQYYQNLLAQVFETKNISFINTFFKQSLIKKRIVMLTKSKSKQIHLFKYALLIPIVLGMLVYTSSEAQERSNNGNLSTSYSFSNDDELIAKLTNELNELIESGEDHQTISKKFFVNSIDYILSKEEYYRQRIYFQYLIKDYGGSKLNKYQITYKEYLKWKKTEKALEVWGSSNPDLFLSLDNDDLENISSEENIKRKKKKEILAKHLFFTKLTLVGTNRGVSFFRNSNEFSSGNALDDSKTDLLNDVTIDVPFSLVEQVPVFPGCENMTNIEQKKCMSNKISKYVNENFNIKTAKENGLTGRQRINVIFKIDKEGHVKGVRSRAPHPALKEEAVRVINLLPKMIPGEQKGEKVNVRYSLPIIFQVADELSNDIDVPFSVVEEVPVFPGCEDFTSNEERRDCMSEKISKLVQAKFNTNIADSLGLKGRQRINVIFKINEMGGITTDEIRARAPHIDLEEEAIRVISTLPKMIPGKQKGKKVNVPYSLPIIFQVQD